MDEVKVGTKQFNRDFLINELNFKTANDTSVYFESDDFVILSPGIQNNRWSFDLSESNVQKIKESSKMKFLIVRYFNDFLLVDFNILLERLLTVDTIYTYNDGSNKKKWSMKVSRENHFFYATVYGSETNEKLSLYTKEELVRFLNEKKTKDFEQGLDKIGGQLKEMLNSKAVIAHTHNFITQKGFLYSQQNITNLYLSLRAKPFVILSGISGTGKTKIVQLFANAVGANYDNGRYRLISVRPDWSDSSDLLGYTNLQGEFVQGQLTDMVIRASDNPQEPHFVVLDEMNLARVEHYLSDFLSVIESRERVDGGITTAPLVKVRGEKYGLPDNLYIIGTVNMDETTYPFSKKVLDRANSIEFNEVHLMNFAMLTELEELSPMAVHNSLFSAEYLYLTELYPQHEALVRDVSEMLEGFNKQLQTIYAQVGYRVRDEICFYMAYAKETELASDEAMDFCIMQKILPRISGAGEELELLLEAFFKDFAGISYAKDVVIPEDAKYARSAKKVQEMRKRLATQGFTSFWIA